jgi:replication factor A1
LEKTYGSSEKKISELKEGEQNVSVTARVIDAQEPRVIETKKGPRTISEAYLGDDTGRIKTTFWGEKAGSVEKGDVVKIEGAWTTSFKGKVQLNVGSKSTVEKVDDSMAPPEEEIPEEEPVAESQGFQQRRGGYRRFSDRSGGRRGRRE